MKAKQEQVVPGREDRLAVCSLACGFFIPFDDLLMISAIFRVGAVIQAGAAQESCGSAHAGLRLQRAVFFEIVSQNWKPKLARHVIIRS